MYRYDCPYCKFNGTGDSINKVTEEMLKHITASHKKEVQIEFNKTLEKIAINSISSNV